jgi:hypothetical protein
MKSAASSLTQLVDAFTQTPDDTVRETLERVLKEWRASPEALDVCLHIISSPGFPDSVTGWSLLTIAHLLDQGAPLPIESILNVCFHHLPSDRNHPLLMQFLDTIFRLIRAQPELCPDPRTVTPSISSLFLWYQYQYLDPLRPYCRVPADDCIAPLTIEMLREHPMNSDWFLVLAVACNVVPLTSLVDFLPTIAGVLKMPLDMALLPSIAKFLDAFVSINPTALIGDPDDLRFHRAVICQVSDLSWELIERGDREECYPVASLLLTILLNVNMDYYGQPENSEVAGLVFTRALATLSRFAEVRSVEFGNLFGVLGSALSNESDESAFDHAGAIIRALDILTWYASEADFFGFGESDAIESECREGLAEMSERMRPAVVA